VLHVRFTKIEGMRKMKIKIKVKLKSKSFFLIKENAGCNSTFLLPVKLAS